MPSNNATKDELREKLAYQKSKTTWYIQEASDWKKKAGSFEARLNTATAKLEKMEKEAAEKVANFKERASKAATYAKNARYGIKAERRKKSETKRELRELMQEVSFFGNEFDWDGAKNVEIVLRSIVAYRQLEANGVVTYEELMFLLTGSQRDAFALSDVEERIGKLGYKPKVVGKLNKLIEAGYFKKLTRRQLWHITPAGEQRLEDIIKHIYTVNIGTYKEVKRILEKI